MAPATATAAAAAMATLAEMEKAACCMIQVIKDTPDLRTTKLALSGDMAIWKYLPEYGHQHAGQSIDLVVNSSTSASLLRKKLLQHPMSPVVESSQLLYYQISSPPATSPKSRPASPASSAFEVRITPEMLCPFLPSAAKPASEIQPVPEQLPYISLEDLIVFKMDACGLRDSTQSKQTEVRHAAALLELATEHSALSLNQDQARMVEESLADVLRHAPSDKQSKAWWQSRLNGTCDPDARKPVKEVLTDMLENMSLDEAAKKSPSDTGSRGILGRTSSSSSKTSLTSMTSASSASSPMSPTTPSFPPPHSRAASKDLNVQTTGPMRPRKFSTSQNSPVKMSHSRKKSVDQGRPARHSQILGSLPSGNIAHNSLLDDGLHASPGLALTARFESTPEDGKLMTGSYF
ncbi:hypothetical protein DHEL01_v206576 [Diaporthe helianthi]|uniref:Uncharacterized protein n=1 Tax=Diaporthe helianthi TaxID=158607 RepID=A0A2P5HXP9_DIAHE|nr:hypothetical protein DHEL01_v206576 [Diaporthe helianthi]